MFCLRRYMEYVAEGGVVAALVEIWNAPCAMVPLNPNELSRELFDAVVRGTTSTGIWNGFDDTIDDRCAFSLREIKMTMFVKGRGNVPAQLRVDSNNRSHQRSHHQRRQARGRGRRLQVAHVRLQGRALYCCTTVACRLAQCPCRGAHL